MTRLRVHTITAHTLSGLSVDFSRHHTQRFPSLHKPLHTFKHDKGYLSFCRFKQFAAIAPGPWCRTLFFLMLHDLLCAGVSSPDTLSGCSSLACIQVTAGNANCVPQLYLPLMLTESENSGVHVVKVRIIHVEQSILLSAQAEPN